MSIIITGAKMDTDRLQMIKVRGHSESIRKGKLTNEIISARLRAVGHTY